MVRTIKRKHAGTLGGVPRKAKQFHAPSKQQSDIARQIKARKHRPFQGCTV